jgi:head-tail adaptor
MRKPVKRHFITIKRPSSLTGTKGQRTGNDTILLRDVPASVETLSGNELELARQTVANATHRVIVWADPENPITTRDYCLFGARVLRIGHYDDPEQKGLEWVLLCSEER